MAIPYPLATILENLTAMRVIRLILIFLVGGLLINLTYKSQFRIFFGDAIFWFFLIIVGLAVLIWTLIIDIKLYKSGKKLHNFTLTFLCTIFSGIILGLEIKIQNNFNKPTLLKVFYDGDYNGAAIDFKKNGTYIFDNCAIGLCDYTYGEYKINGNNITLDKDNIGNITNLKHLEIKEKQIEYRDSARSELYLFQVDEKSNIIEGGLEYRVTIDNRKQD